VELLFVALGGAILGLVAHFVIPGQVRRGVVVLPALGTVLISVVWEGLTWAGLAYSDFLIWGITFAVTIIAVFGFGITLGRRRTTADDLFFASMTKTGRAS
jgi:quaternary ammonium compound-resistance protein SugE